MIRQFYLYGLIVFVIALLGTFLHQQNEDNESKPYIQQQSETPSLINVKLMNYIGNVNELSVSLTGSYLVNHTSMETNKTYRLRIENGQLALYDGLAKVGENSSYTFAPNQYNHESHIRINNRPYLGTVRFIIEGAFIRPINTLPIEDYLKGVVPYEMPALWAIDALKVQAVAARTYAMAHGNKIIDDSINYQVYPGYAWHPTSTRAVHETNGQTLWHNERLALTVYSSTNGGMTESNQNIWGGQSLPYLPIQQDPYDPIHPWSFQINKTQIDLSNKDLNHPDAWWATSKEVDTTMTNNIKTWLTRNGYPSSEIKIISIPTLSFSEQRTSGSRVQRGNMTVQFVVKSLNTNEYIKNEAGSLRIHEMKLEDTTAQRIRAMIGASFIRSYLVDTVVDNQTSFIVSGRGFGHGVGMSQWGAKRMADQGFNYQDILQFYYPGTTLTTLETPVPNEIPKQEAPQSTREITLTVGHKQALVDQGSIQLLEAPFIKNSRTLIPLRFVSEQLGAHVNWSNVTKTITITDHPNTLVLREGSKTVAVNGTNRSIDATPEIMRGTTFVPLRFVSEQLNGTVHWNPSDKTIVVTRTLAR